MIRRPPGSTRTDTLFPCTTLFRSGGLDDASSLAFAPNTHDFLRRLLSCLPVGRPPRILTSDGEFHSFTRQAARLERSEEHTSELQSLMRISYAVFCLKKKHTHMTF